MTNPKILFIDGHDSHFGFDALQYALNHGVYIIFLRSNASCLDQPNDNGHNCMFKHCYGIAVHEYQQKLGPLIKYSKSDCNAVLATAFANLLASKKYQPTIVNAFGNCGLFPLSAGRGGM